MNNVTYALLGGASMVIAVWIHPQESPRTYFSALLTVIGVILFYHALVLTP